MLINYLRPTMEEKCPQQKKKQEHRKSKSPLWKKPLWATSCLVLTNQRWSWLKTMGEGREKKQWKMPQEDRWCVFAKKLSLQTEPMMIMMSSCQHQDCNSKKHILPNFTGRKYWMLGKVDVIDH